jgi:hypothetical protein
VARSTRCAKMTKVSKTRVLSEKPYARARTPELGDEEFERILDSEPFMIVRPASRGGGAYSGWGLLCVTLCAKSFQTFAEDNLILG